MLNTLRSFFAVGLLALTAGNFLARSVQGETTIPAYTAYLLPNPDGARVSEARGINRWIGPEQTILWYGDFKSTGELTAKIALRLPEGKESKLKLTIGDSSFTSDVKGRAGDQDQIVDFGTFTISSVGYQKISLESLNAPEADNGVITSLILDGPALKDAHFNMKERRNAASVHLMYPVPDRTPIAAFYCEVTAVEDPTTTFYMACGWHRGYFGMQVNSPTERRIIFSVWDSGNEGIDRDKVADENRVRLIDKGENVYTGDFGNEGTGGHSHLKVMWKTGEKQRFLVTAEPVDKTFTTFAGYWFHPEKQQWMLISAWKAPKEGGYLKGPHSFSENFWGSSGHIVRKALYDNQWIRKPDGEWIELTDARFSHDPTGQEDRLDRCMGVEEGAFFLRHGGFLTGSTKYGESFRRPPRNQKPDVEKLPLLKK